MALPLCALCHHEDGNVQAFGWVSRFATVARSVHVCDGCFEWVQSEDGPTHVALIVEGDN